MFEPAQGGHALDMKHTDIVTPDASSAATPDRTGAIGGVASAVASTGRFGVRGAVRQARRHPKAASIVFLVALAAYGGWRWSGRRSDADEPLVVLLDAA